MKDDRDRSDFAAEGERLRVRELVAAAARPERVIVRRRKEPRPKGRTCACGMSRPAFPTIADFTAHRTLCEN